MRTIKLFIYDSETKYDDFDLSLNAGYVDSDGIICNSQKGIEDTFSVGMPVYDYSGKELGKLSIGLWENLNYSNEYEGIKIPIKIPVENWRIFGYSGEEKRIKTYHQIKSIKY